MGVGFIHLSDIHFGQERGGDIIIHNDVKEQLIIDVATAVKSLSSGNAVGLIVTGDIAYSGQKSEYDAAGIWLDRIAEAAGCEKTNIQMVPGNHDIDRNEIGAFVQGMLKSIIDSGESALDGILSNEQDRGILYQRFSSYSPFASAYRCPLDTNGSLAEDRILELAPGRWIRFVRLNSALICSKKDVKGTLMLGARQRVLNQRPGEELIVLSHHPMDWFQDSEDALLYLKSRARVFISGHEHNHSVNIQNVENGCDLMMLASGAAIPHDADEIFNYCYNTLEFDWNSSTDSLVVHVRPRVWNNQMKRFEDGTLKQAGYQTEFHLASPNFRGAPRTGGIEVQPVDFDSVINTIVISPNNRSMSGLEESNMVDNYPLLILRFFRDLSPAQRISILVSLDAIPQNYNGKISESFERRAFDSLVRQGKSEELLGKLNKVLESQLESRGNNDNS